METMSVASITLCLTLEVVNGDILFSATTLRVKFAPFVMDIYCAKFQEHCFNSSRDIVYAVFTSFQLQYYDIITDLICLMEESQYL